MIYYRTYFLLFLYHVVMSCTFYHLHFAHSLLIRAINVVSAVVVY